MGLLLEVDLLFFLTGLNLTVITRTLGSSSLSLVAEDFESLLTRSLLVFKGISITNYIGKVAGVGVRLIRLLILRPALIWLPVLAVVRLFRKISRTPMLLLSHLV